MRFFVTEQISPNIAETPEGFLICADVPIARTGVQEYNISESDVMPWLKDFEAGPGGLIIIERTPEEVFRPETMASFEGKSITIDHPEGFVIPENFHELEIGTIQNVRRGSDIQTDLLLADFIIKAPDAISFVKSGLRQVSCGYDADYVQTEPGRGKQINIIGNHVALVKHGRAGVRCMIMDSTKIKQEVNMTFREQLRMLKLRTIDGLSEEEAKKQVEEEKKTKDAEGEEVEMSKFDQMMAILKSLVDSHKEMAATIDCIAKDKKVKDAEGETGEEKKAREAKEAEDKKTKDAEEEEAKKKEEEEKGKTGDSAYKDTAVRAAILAPEFKMPTSGKVVDIRRKALAAAYTQDSYKSAIEPFLIGGLTIDRLSEDAINAAFIGASEIVAVKNNLKITQGGTARNFATTDSAAIANINEKAKAHWAGQR